MELTTAQPALTNAASIKTILVVDDQSVIREPIAAALEHFGFQVLRAATGREAINLLNQQRPDVIVIDFGLPDMNGLEVVSAVRNTPTAAAIPIIMLTINDSRETVMAAARLGVKHYLLKSQFSLRELISRIDGLPAEANAGSIARQLECGSEK